MKKSLLITIIIVSIAASSLIAQKNATINWFGYLRSGYRYTIEDEGDNSGQFDMLLSTLGFVADINEYSQVFVFAYFDAAALTGVESDTLGSLMVDSRNVAAILDAEIRFKPIDHLQLTVGQFVTPFGTENLQSASKTDFIGRGYVVRNSPAYRDIGAYLKYNHEKFTLYGGVVNGSGMNVVDANNHKNIVARAEARPIEGLFFSGAASMGKDNNPVEDDALPRNFYSANLSYKLKGLYVTAETSIQDYDGDMTSALYAYAQYDIPVDTKLLHYVTPGFRYDYLDPPADGDKIDRMTFGLTFGFDETKWLSHFRVNYEMVTGEGNDEPDNLVAEFQMRFD